MRTVQQPLDKSMTLWIGFFLGVTITCLCFVWVHIRELWSDIDLIRRDVERRIQIRDMEAKYER